MQLEQDLSTPAACSCCLHMLLAQELFHVTEPVRDTLVFNTFVCMQLFNQVNCRRVRLLACNLHIVKIAQHYSKCLASSSVRCTVHVTLQLSLTRVFASLSFAVALI
jgi:magnesium-transporting ATPase (P-type)